MDSDEFLERLQLFTEAADAWFADFTARINEACQLAAQSMIGLISADCGAVETLNEEDKSE